MDGVHPEQLLMLGLIALVALVTALAKRLRTSYAVLLVLVGLLVSLVPRVPEIPLPPYVVFYVFLPPLLFSAAWQTSWREFKRSLVSISMLAVGLVFFTAVGIALTAHYFLPGFDWRLGFLLGAIVSPTDAVAATSIARRVGMPQNIVDVLEGESLLNDATGLLALQFGVQLITGGSTPPLGHAALEFFWLIIGGVLAGLLCGVLMTWLERFVDDGPVEIILSLLATYGSYLLGEGIHGSGVISTVVCGLYLSRKSSTFFSSDVRLQAVSVWQVLEFTLNGLVFILIGLQLPGILKGIQGMSRGQLALDSIIFSAALIVLRLVWVYPGGHVAYAIRTRLLKQNYPRPGARALFVVGWTGMRGVVALAAALSLPMVLENGEPLPHRSLIIFLTYVVIVVTLVGQGFTLPPLVRALGLKPGSAERCEENEARGLVLQSAIDYLDKEKQTHEEREAHAIDDVLHYFTHRVEELRTSREKLVAEEEVAKEAPFLYQLRCDLLATQRQRLMELRNEARIGDAVFRTIERELDLEAARLGTQS
jgi:Na+/H+ antiporter